MSHASACRKNRKRAVPVTPISSSSHFTIIRWRVLRRQAIRHAGSRKGRWPMARHLIAMGQGQGELTFRARNCSKRGCSV